MLRSSIAFFVLATLLQSSADRKAADDLFRNQEWSRAAEAYAAVVAADPTDAAAWFQLGYSRYSLHDLRGAIAAFTQASEHGVAPIAAYDRACAHALLGEKDAAFDALEQALLVGFGDVAKLQNDADLATLRTDARFAQLVAQLASPTAPAAAPAEARALDFWVGEWDVHPARGGPLVGHSKVEKILDGAVILENWTGQGGGAGKSFNTFDARTQRWRQHWVDNRGSAVDFTDGRAADHSVEFQSVTATPGGHPLQRKLTFFDQGPSRVRQLSRGSLDGGKTWFVEYDFVYDRAS